MAQPAHQPSPAPTAASWPWPAIGQAQLNNLAYYKYASVDRSLITKYIMKPYWDWAVTLFPLWLAPNMITFIGFAFILINFATMLVYIPDLTSAAPSWVYFSFALGLHLYQTFDNVDGRQARRTKTSSPLGELFDHGCDALNTSISAILQAATVGLGHSWHTIILLMTVIAAFYLSTWEEYHTHVLQFGYVNGPCEGILLGTAIMAVTGFYGPAIWKTPLVHILTWAGVTGPLAYIPSEWTLVEVLLAFLVVCLFVVQIPTSIGAVYFHCMANGKPFFDTLLRLVPLLVMTTATFAWVSASTSTILTSSNVILFGMCTGVIFGRFATKIITAYVTQEAFPFMTIQMIPLILGAINANMHAWIGLEPIIPYKYEGIFLAVTLAFCVVQYLLWAYVIIRDFCRALKIRAFSIPYPGKDKLK